MASMKAAGRACRKGTVPPGSFKGGCASSGGWQGPACPDSASPGFHSKLDFLRDSVTYTRGLSFLLGFEAYTAMITFPLDLKYFPLNTVLQPLLSGGPGMEDVSCF